MKFQLNKSQEISTETEVSLGSLYEQFPKNIVQILSKSWLKDEKIIALLKQKKYDEIPDNVKNFIVEEFVCLLNSKVDNLESQLIVSENLNDPSDLYLLLSDFYKWDRFLTKLAKDITKSNPYSWKEEDTIRVFLSNIINLKKPLPKKMWLVIKEILVKDQAITPSKVEEAFSQLWEMYSRVKSNR